MDPRLEVEAVTKNALEEIKSITNEQALAAFYAKYLAKKGQISLLMGRMKDILPNERASFGKAINDAKNEVSNAYKTLEEELAKKALNKKLEEEKIDLSLPGRTYFNGSINPYWIIVDEMVDIFSSLGFKVFSGRDVETDHYNFELLNVPKDHPARDMQDTFYISDSLLLRTQTSAAQAHSMLDNKEKKPLRIVCPGKCYRRDDDDMTHSHQFGQIEGLLVDKNISMADLKGTLELFVKKMFGEKREIRLRSSYFPFTEPSVEVDVSCSKCGGKGCSMCKGTGWIEILGAGEVHPNVLRMCGYDPDVYSGFAFGVGIERVALLRYGIDDIRRIYANDLRFLKSFHEK